MNLREGTRRVALLLGVVGAIYGGFRSYPDLHFISEVRADNIKFEQLTASPVVQQVIQQTRQSLEIRCAKDPSDSQCGNEYLGPMTDVNSGGIKLIWWSSGWDRDGNKIYSVDGIETEDGQDLFLHPIPLPPVESFLRIVLPRIVPGFLIPWVAVLVIGRAIGWVGAGFVQPRG